jgi:sugar/nucleoside kinase (ribokinase family)
MTPHIAVVGSINADLVVQMPKLPGRGETVSSAEPAWFPGGKGANQAVAAARMGGNVSMFGAIGADEPGQMCLFALKQSGVDVDAVAKVSSPTSTALVMVEHSGENQIVVADGANQHASVEIVTAGPKEVVAYQNGEAVAKSQPPKVEALDTVGAGDTFVGAFVVAYASGKSISDSLDVACAASALSTLKLGAQSGMPTASEVSEYLLSSAN